MTISLTQILNKENSIGDAVGKALILNLINQYKGERKNFTQNELSTTLSNLSTTQLGRYYCYVGLQQWLQRYFAISQAYYQQAQASLSKLFNEVTNTSHVEESFAKLAPLPLEFKEALEYFSFFPCTEDSLDSMEAARDALKEGLIEVLCFNKSIELIEEVIKLDISSIFTKNMERFNSYIQKFNNEVKYLIKNLTGDEAERRKKRLIVLTVFPTINLKALEPKKHSVDKTRILIRDLTTFASDPGAVMKTLKLFL